MESSLLSHEAAVRLGSFFGLLVVFGAIELRYPGRPLTGYKGLRWFGNLGLSVINSVVVRAAFPVLAIGMAQRAEAEGWGLLNRISFGAVVEFVFALAVFDFVIYLQHAMFHFVPTLWRLHRVHHTDVDLDVSSAVRFHFLEIMISMVIKLATVAVLGPPVLAVLVFEVWLNATSMFHHSNLRLPRPVDRVLRWFIVTPDMHRIHHSILVDETNSNFGFNLPLWDRVMGTYRDQPRAGHDAMILGIEDFRGRADQRLDRLLIQPLMRAPGAEEREALRAK